MNILFLYLVGVAIATVVIPYMMVRFNAIKKDDNTEVFFLVGVMILLMIILWPIACGVLAIVMFIKFLLRRN